MADRRSLVEGMQPVDRELEKAFVYKSRPAESGSPESLPAATLRPVIDRQPISSRLRADIVTALKRASLERQLQGVAPSSLQEMMEEALEPWLKKHGYLP